MRVEYKFDITLEIRRCCDCNRWFGTEVFVEWKCGSCKSLECQRLDAEIAELKRSQAALRGALTRRKP